MVAALVAASVAVVAPTPAYAIDNTVAVYRCALTSRTGNTTTITFPNGGSMRVTFSPCIGWQVLTRNYMFTVNVNWTYTNRPSVPFDDFKLDMRGEDNNADVTTWTCSLFNEVNWAGTTGGKTCYLGPVSRTNADRVMTSDATAQWNVNSDGKVWLPAHDMTGSPPYRADEFSTKDIVLNSADGSFCRIFAEKPMRDAANILRARGGTQCTGATSGQFGYDASTDLYRGTQLEKYAQKQCTGPTPSINPCMAETWETDPSGTQTWQTLVEGYLSDQAGVAHSFTQFSVTSSL